MNLDGHSTSAAGRVETGGAVRTRIEQRFELAPGWGPVSVAVLLAVLWLLWYDCPDKFAEEWVGAGSDAASLRVTEAVPDNIAAVGAATAGASESVGGETEWSENALAAGTSPPPEDSGIVSPPETTGAIAPVTATELVPFCPQWPTASESSSTSSPLSSSSPGRPRAGGRLYATPASILPYGGPPGDDEPPSGGPTEREGGRGAYPCADRDVVVFVYGGWEALSSDLVRIGGQPLQLSMVGDLFVHERLLGSEPGVRLTEDPDEADLFFVPFYSTLRAVLSVPNLQSPTPEQVDVMWTEVLERLERGSPGSGAYWRRREGRDHLWVLTRDFGACLVFHEETALEVRVPAAVRRGVIASPFGHVDMPSCHALGADIVTPCSFSMRVLDRALVRAAFDLGVADLREPLGKAARTDLALFIPPTRTFVRDPRSPAPPNPLPTRPLVRLPARSRDGYLLLAHAPLWPELYEWVPTGVFAEYAASLDRPRLVHYKGQGVSIRGVRERLVKVLESDTRLHFHDAPVTGSRNLTLNWGAFQDAAFSSEFCLCPAGYAPWSQRLVELMLAGCIPVVVSDDVVLPHADRVDWSKCSVRLAEADIERLFDVLSAISSAERDSMRRYALEVFPRLLLLRTRLPGTWGRRDAFDELFESVRARLRVRPVLPESAAERAQQEEHVPAVELNE